jgi:release factor glutamine methyltransferase
MRLAETTKKITELFEQHSLANAAKEAEFFVREVLDITLTDFVLQKDKVLLPEQTTELFTKAKRRASGEPLAYIVGYKDFYKERFVVNPSVLIPRADTEVLVEEALRLSPPPQKFADLGTGSGCIGLSLLMEWPKSLLTTIDVSREAIQTAQQNARRLGLTDRVDFVCGDVLDQQFSEPFDLVLSNPPYISPEDPRLEAAVKLHEPDTALYAEEEGLFFYKRWTPWAKQHLREGGWLLFECGEGQATEIQSICLQNGFKNIKISKDLASKDRVIAAQKPNAQ